MSEQKHSKPSWKDNYLRQRGVISRQPSNHNFGHMVWIFVAQLVSFCPKPWTSAAASPALQASPARWRQNNFLKTFYWFVSLDSRITQKLFAIFCTGGYSFGGGTTNKILGLVWIRFRILIGGCYMQCTH